MQCKDCKKELPENAELCANCGRAVKAAQRWSDMWLLLLTAFVFAVGALVFFFSAPKTPSSAAPIAGRMQSDVSNSLSGQVR